MRRRLLALFASIGLAIGSVTVLTQSPALATDVNNYCGGGAGSGDMCYWYHSDFTGAKAGLWQNVPDLLNPRVIFPGPGSGVGERIGNNAGSGANYDTVWCANVWFHANYTGAVLTLSPYLHTGWYHNTLGVVNNDNRSQSWTYCG